MQRSLSQVICAYYSTNWAACQHESASMRFPCRISSGKTMRKEDFMMSTTASHRRAPGRPGQSRRTKGTPLWLRLLKGLGAAILVTIVGVAVFALLMQWIRPSDTVVRIFNQVLKLTAIGVGVFVAVGKGQEGGLLKGAAVGVLYMALGVAVYAVLSGQQAPVSAYLADLGMGVAGGGIMGMILSNMEG